MENLPKITVADLVEVTLAKPDDFLKVKETLTRIGISSKAEKKLYQSCHILHKRGKYYIVHFKELFALDGLPSSIDEADIARRNTIATLLDEWSLVKLVDPTKIQDVTAGLGQIKIIPHKEKGEWELVPKYHIGKKF
jgi:Bacteriophage translational regulator